MDVSNLIKGEPEARWYAIATNGAENEPRVRIRTPSPKKLREIAKQTGTSRVTREVTEQDLENKRFQDELVDYMVVGWENITAEGEPFACTRENKSFLMDEWLEFFTLVLDVVNVSTVSAKRALETERKN